MCPLNPEVIQQLYETLSNREIRVRHRGTSLG